MKRLLCAVAVIAMAVPDAAAARQPGGPHAAAQSKAHGQASRARTRAHAHATRQARPRMGRMHARHVQTMHATRTTRIVRVHRVGARPAHFRPINVSAFRYPPGYHYRRYRIGRFLPAIFLSSPYYFYDYGRLRFGPPPRGYVWVRYGPDLLLVNRRTGRIIDVIYGAFY